jgi:hypothetical protein
MADGAIKPSIERWHSHLDHPAIPIVQRVIRKFDLPCLAQEENDSVCNACQQAKSHQLPYPKSISKSSKPLKLIFSNVWGTTPKYSGRYKYYISFIDGYNKFMWIYLIKFRSEVF